MLEFILNNSLFETIINTFLVINSLITIVLSHNEYKNDIKNDNTEKLSKLKLFKIITIITYSIILAIIITYFSFKLNLTSYLILIYYIICFFISINLSNKNINELSSENKITHMQSSLLFIMFFSAKSTTIYLDSPLNLSHEFKEYLLLFFVITKLIFFIYCAIINVSIFLSNLYLILNKKIDKFVLFLKSFLNKYYEIKFYNFNFSKKNNKLLKIVLDIVIYILTCPFFIVYNLLYAILILLIKFLIKKILFINNIIQLYLNNSSSVIRTEIKISTIISFVIVYIITTYNQNIFSETTKDIYNLITTVILIPLIYDSIKSK